MQFFHRRSSILWLTDKTTASNKGDFLLDFLCGIERFKDGEYVRHKSTNDNALARAKVIER
jgi:hypothetical protein